MTDTKEVIFVEGMPADSHLNPRAMGIPPDLAEGAEIYNAARPLYGHKEWTGEFRHGVFYAAIYPDRDYADEYRRRNLELDAGVCITVTITDIERWGREYVARLNRERNEHRDNRGLPPVTDLDYDDLDFEDVLTAYLRQGGKSNVS